MKTFEECYRDIEYSVELNTTLYSAAILGASIMAAAEVIAAANSVTGEDMGKKLASSIDSLAMSTEDIAYSVRTM